jgi:orotidine-5'-phosphate decarboxylase
MTPITKPLPETIATAIATTAPYHIAAARIHGLAGDRAAAAATQTLTAHILLMATLPNSPYAPLGGARIHHYRDAIRTAIIRAAETETIPQP